MCCDLLHKRDNFQLLCIPNNVVWYQNNAALTCAHCTLRQSHMINPQRALILNKYTLSGTTLFEADVYFISCMSTTVTSISFYFHFIFLEIYVLTFQCKFSVVIFFKGQMKRHG